jgi:hypothetical protein
VAVTAQEIEETWYERIGVLSSSEPLIHMLASLIFILPLLNTSPIVYRGLSTRCLLACGALGAYAFITSEAWRVWVEEETDRSATRRRRLVLHIVGFYGLIYLLLANTFILYALWLSLLDPPAVTRIVSAIASVTYIVVVPLTLLFTPLLYKKRLFDRFLPIKRFSEEHLRWWKYVWPVSVVWGLLAIIGWALGLGRLDFLLRLGAEIGLFVCGLLVAAISMGHLFQFGVLAWAGISDALRQDR